MPQDVPLLDISAGTGLPVRRRKRPATAAFRAVGAGLSLVNSTAKGVVRTAGSLATDLISVGAPGLALKMSMARDAYMQKRALYGAPSPADASRLTHHRTPQLREPDAELAGKQSRIRAYTREEVRNNPVAANIKRTHANNTVGDADVGQGVTIDPAIVDKDGEPMEKLNQELKQLWQQYRDRLEYSGRWGFADLLGLADRELIESGEVLAIMHDRPAPGSDIPYSIEIVEADRLPHDNDTWLHSRTAIGQLNEFILADKDGMPLLDAQKKAVTHHVKHGIEYDPAGQIHAYHILADHPGSESLFHHTFQTRRIEADRVVHYFSPDRAEQTRGVTRYLPALSILQNLHDLLDWELLAAKVQAIFGVHFAGPVANVDQVFRSANPPKDALGNNVTQLQPGMVTQGGEKAEFYQGNRPGNTFLPFFQGLLRLCGCAVGMGYSTVAKDWSTGAYSALRQEDNEDDRTYTSDMGLHARHLCARHWARFVKGAVLAGKVSLSPKAYAQEPARYHRHAIDTPGRKHINPLQEITAQAVALANGIICPDEAINESGLESDDRLKKLAAYLALAKQLNIPIAWARGEPNPPTNDADAIADADNEAEGDKAALSSAKALSNGAATPCLTR